MSAATQDVVKENTAQRVERIKRERAPWSIMDDIRRYAREGFASIPDEDLSVRFRAWGLYTQGDGRGTRGDAAPYFMMRVRTPNGLLTAEQVHAIAGISDRYARGSIDITNRQNFQLHWLRIEDIPAVWDALSAVGWTSMGACGDNTRTVTGCPLAGVEGDEILDASPYALAVDQFLNGNAEYANLPRKFKITITGCTHWCTYPEINDIGVTGVRRGDDVGFHIRVGGGLSTRPHLALRLDAFVYPTQLLDVVTTIAAIFRDSDELRQNRNKARMKFLFVNHGWTADRFLGEIERRLGYGLEPAASEVLPRDGYRDHVGIHRQKQSGLHYAGFSVLAGRITTRSLQRIANLADRFGDGTLRTTATQNILVLNIPESALSAFTTEASELDPPLRGSPFQRGTLSCTGSEFCKLAITETKRFSIGLAHEMERRLPGFSEEIKVHVAGCPNSCGQHWIADVGLQGVLLGEQTDKVEGFDFFIGGGLGAGAALARRVGYRAPAHEVANALERLFSAYVSSGLADESFRSWVERVSDAHVKEVLAAARRAIPLEVHP